MKFMADEGVDRQIVDRLRQDGHRVWYVAEMQSGIPDDAVLDLANREEALLLTADKDFGELVYREQFTSLGIVLIRRAGLSPTAKAERVSIAVQKHTKELSEAFSVITAHAIRIRRKMTTRK